MANSANASACQKSLFAKLVGGGVNYPQFAMVTLLRLAACSVPWLIGLTTACFRALRAAFVRPPPLPPPQAVSAKILRISGRGNCKETIFALENGIFRRKNRPAPAVHAAGDD